MLACKSVASLRGAEGWRRRQAGLLRGFLEGHLLFAKNHARPTATFAKSGWKLRVQTEGADWPRAFIFPKISIEISLLAKL
jgi:hypothetical protein